jgi:hypothetical protein
MLRDMGLELFREVIVLDPLVSRKLSHGLLSTIENERNGEIIDKALVRRLLKMQEAVGVCRERERERERERYSTPVRVRNCTQSDHCCRRTNLALTTVVWSSYIRFISNESFFKLRQTFMNLKDKQRLRHWLYVSCNHQRRFVCNTKHTHSLSLYLY